MVTLEFEDIGTIEKPVIAADKLDINKHQTAVFLGFSRQVFAKLIAGQLA